MSVVSRISYKGSSAVLYVACTVLAGNSKHSYALITHQNGGDRVERLKQALYNSYACSSQRITKKQQSPMTTQKVHMDCASSAKTSARDCDRIIIISNLSAFIIKTNDTYIQQNLVMLTKC